MFHNANLFGSCIIHILYTGCAKIKKNNSGAKGLTFIKPSGIRIPLGIACKTPNFAQIRHWRAPYGSITKLYTTEALVFVMEIYCVLCDI